MFIQNKVLEKTEKDNAEGKYFQHLLRGYWLVNKELKNNNLKRAVLKLPNLHGSEPAPFSHTGQQEPAGT